jgi:hypothetical protein
MEEAPSLSAADVAAFDRDGCVLLRGFLSAEEVRDLVRWVNDLQVWCPPTPAEQLSGAHYTFHHEQLEDGRRGLCRIENYCNFHGGLDGIARERLAPVAGALLRAAGGARLFKEKLNVKHPGGKAYAAHYDGPSAAALGLARTFITAQVAVDAQTALNGCMQVLVPRAAWPPAAMVPPRGSDPDRDGRVGAIPEDVAEALDWECVECAPGDVLFFDGMMPHRSGPNRSDAQRRTLYMIFNPAEEGDHHDAYYAEFARLRAAALAAAVARGAGGGAAAAAAADAAADAADAAAAAQGATLP